MVMDFDIIGLLQPVSIKNEGGKWKLLRCVCGVLFSFVEAGHSFLELIYT